MANLKTKPTDDSIDEFLAAVEDKGQRQDATRLVELMRDVTGEEPQLWGTSMVGFGTYHYRYESGREGDWFLTGFAPRKSSLSLYIMSGFDEYDDLMGKLGKHKTGKSCLYVNRLADIDEDVLRELVKRSVEHTKSAWS